MKLSSCWWVLSHSCCCVSSPMDVPNRTSIEIIRWIIELLLNSVFTFSFNKTLALTDLPILLNVIQELIIINYYDIIQTNWWWSKDDWLKRHNNQICCVFVGMDTNNVKRQISDQQLPSVSSQTFHEPCSVHKRRTNNEEKALATYKNKQCMREVGGEAKTSSSMKVLYQHKP